MEVIIDGYIYQYQTHGGISRDFDHLIPELCDQNDQLHVKLFLRRKPIRPLPSHKNLSIINFSRIDGLFRPLKLLPYQYSKIYNIFLQLLMANTQRKIWFPTYYLKPPFRWFGYQVYLVYDLIHEMYPERNPNSEGIIKLKNSAFKDANEIICISKTTAADILRYYLIPHSKIHVAENGFNRSFHQKSLQEIRHTINFPFILFVGKRFFYKGFDTLLNAYSNWTKNNDFKLLVVGEKWTQEEEISIKKNNLQDQVLLLNNISDEYLIDVYSQAKAFIYPSLYEGFGIPLLEAMSCGCPIVASKIPSTIEVAKDIPYYFEPNDATGLIMALDKALSDNNSANKIKAGIENVKYYSWERMATEVLKVFENLNVPKPF